MLARQTPAVTGRQPMAIACAQARPRYNLSMPDDMPTQRADDEPDLTDLPTAMAPNWALVLHDDPETPADFVYFVLERFCGHGEEQARAVVNTLTSSGKAVAAVLPERIARIKQAQIEEEAKGKYPLKATLEPVE
jgi:ATP-dependent Clp protease adaptor protein ClpS